MSMNFWQRNRVKKAAIEKSKVSKVARPIGAFVQGHSAFKRGDSFASCPYKEGTSDYEAWKWGFMGAQHGTD